MTHLVKEFVPPETYEAEGDRAILHIDQRVIIALEQIDEFLGVKAVVNNWHLGMHYRYRGYRPASCSIGAPHSMHREINGHLCGAIDATWEEKSADYVRSVIVVNQEKFPYIYRMETGIPWVHIDIKGIDEHPRNGIKLFRA
jgi:hypothetical protein